MFQSPQAHELLHFFNRCFSAGPKQYRDDEFSLTDEQGDYVFTFRPEQRYIGRYHTSTGIYTIQPEFEGAQAIFEQKVTELRQQLEKAV